MRRKYIAMVLGISLIISTVPANAVTIQDEEECASYGMWTDNDSDAQLLQSLFQDMTENGVLHSLLLQILYWTDCPDKDMRVGQSESFNVTVAYPSESDVVVNDTVTIIGNITNPNPVTTTQQVELRDDGDLLQQNMVQIPGNESTTVRFPITVSATWLGDKNESVHRFTVQTREFGEPVWIVIHSEEATNQTQLAKKPT